MSKLVAHFEVDLPGQCFVACPENQDILLNCAIEEFDVAMRLIKAYGPMRPNDVQGTFVIRRVSVSVSKNENDFQPTGIPNDINSFLNTPQAAYFRLTAYKAVNRLIRYFKFQLKTPFLRELPLHHKAFYKARWTDNLGTEIGKDPVSCFLSANPGINGELGVLKFCPESDDPQNVLQIPFEPKLHEKILSDAQTALFEDDLRRAVLEMAIACEVVVKQRFFAENALAGYFYDYLNRKSKIKVRVLDLIDGISNEVFGRSFKTDYRKHYDNIDHLFRCRNQVAHRGNLSYRDDSGTPHEVDYNIVAAWWGSITTLVDWIK